MLENANSFIVTETDQQLPEGQRMVCKSHGATFGINRSIMYLDCSHNFMAMYIIQNALSRTLHIEAVMYINYTSINCSFKNHSFMTSQGIIS